MNEQPKYSRTEFEGYTHRFVVEFEIVESSHTYRLDIYSDSGDYGHMEDFINTHKKPNVLSSVIVHRASKEQDELASEMIEESLKGW